MEQISIPAPPHTLTHTHTHTHTHSHTHTMDNNGNLGYKTENWVPSLAGVKYGC